MSESEPPQKPKNPFKDILTPRYEHWPPPGYEDCLEPPEPYEKAPTPPSVQWKLRDREAYGRDWQALKAKAKPMGLALTPKEITRLKQDGKTPQEIFNQAPRKDKFALAGELIERTSNEEFRLLFDELPADLTIRIHVLATNPERLDKFPEENPHENLALFNFLNEALEIHARRAPGTNIKTN